MKLKGYIRVSGALAAVLAVSAMAASVAQGAAPRLTVGGVTPGTGVNFPFTAVSTGSENAAMEQGKEVGTLETSLLTLTNPSGSCSIVGSLTGSAANTAATGNSLVLTCKEVHVKDFPACTVNGKLGGEVSSNRLDARAVFIGPKGNDQYGVTFTPEAGKLFASISLGGATCQFLGVTVEVGGTIVGAVETPTTDKTTQALSFPTPAITEVLNGTTGAGETDGLTIFGEPAQFTNTFDITLNSKEAFGVETG